MDAGSQEGGRTLVTVEIEEAQARLSELVDRAVQGEAFVIAKAGKPLVRMAAVEAHQELQRLGFLGGEVAVPDDFNRMGEVEIAARFGSGG